MDMTLELISGPALLRHDDGALTFPNAASTNLRQRIVSFLHARSVPTACCVEVEAHDGAVVIRGRLPSPQAKRLCIECCRRVAGVITLIDEIEVEEVKRRRS